MMNILFFQSADPTRYLPMLSVTAPNIAAYCQRHGFAYESFVGVKRGYWPWQASYNRIFQYRELLDCGFRGWAVHVDADAWVNDLNFDLPAYLADKGDRAAILAATGISGTPWDINDGVVLLNLDHPQGRRLVERWHEDFLAIPDTVLSAARDWLGTGNDQDLLQDILRRDPDIAHAVLVESRDVINSRRARFIRQHLRTDTSDLQRRIHNISAEVGAAMQDGSVPKPTINDDRAVYGLRRPNPNGDELRLVEAPEARVDHDAAAAAIAFWKAAPPAETPAHLQALGAALAAADAGEVAHMLAGFGRSSAALGQLGGPRQHRRAAEDDAFARRRAVRTQDALVSLAEACGALRPENPEVGSWGFNVRVPAAELLDRLGEVLGADVSPPDALGGYLGIDAGRGRVLHLRMVEALHSAWRIRQIQALLGCERVLEFDGGVGLRACYAQRLGARAYAILNRQPVLGAVQAYLLKASGTADQVGPVPTVEAPPADLLFNEESLPEHSEAQEIDRIRAARDRGVRAILSVNQEARDIRDAPRPTMRQLVDAAGGFRLVQRGPHAIRPGFVEELFVTN